MVGISWRSGNPADASSKLSERRKRLEARGDLNLPRSASHISESSMWSLILVLLLT